MAAAATSKKLWRWGIAGCGSISWDFSMCLAAESRSKIQAFAARRVESAQSFAAEFGAAHAFGSYQELFRDSTVDIVYIGTIHPTHHDLVIDALNSGKHVLCEKPMAMNSKQVRNILECANGNGVFFAEACWTRYFPAVRRLKSFIDGTNHDKDQISLGKLISYNGNLGIKMPGPDEAPRLWENNMGGGSLLDIGIYPCHLVPFAFGAERVPKEISALGLVDSKHQIDTVVNCAIKYSNREYATVHSNFFSTSSNTYTFTFENGMVSFLTHHPERMEIVMHDPMKTIVVSKRIIEEYPLVAHESFTKNGQRRFNFSNSNGLFYQASGVIDALEKGAKESDCMRWMDSVRTHEIMDEIRRQIGMKYKEDDPSMFF